MYRKTKNVSFFSNGFRRKNSFIEELEKKILENPKTCDMCGKVESKGDIFLKYDCGMWLCDDCMMKYYKDDNF